MKAHLKRLAERYGSVFLGVYLLLTVLSYAGFFQLIGLTWQAQGAAQEAGTFFGAWLASKATQPLRILAAAVITRVVAPLIWRFFPNLAPKSQI